MLFGEFLVLFGILATTGLGFMYMSRRYQDRRRRHDKMVDDLKRALESRDYQQLDDFLVIYHHEIDYILRDFVNARRAELFLERNP